MVIVLSLLYTPLDSIFPLHTQLPFLPPLIPEGSHTLSKTVVTSSGGFGMMARFTKKKSTCIGCRAVLEREGEPLEIIFRAVYPIYNQCFLDYMHQLKDHFPPLLYLTLPSSLPSPPSSPLLVLPFQMRQYANTARCESQRSTRRRWLISLLWRRSFLDCGPSASVARAASMKTSCVQGVEWMWVGEQKIAMCELKLEVMIVHSPHCKLSCQDESLGQILVVKTALMCRIQLLGHMLNSSQMHACMYTWQGQLPQDAPLQCITETIHGSNFR